MGGLRMTTEEVKLMVEGKNGSFLGEETIKAARVIHIKCGVCGNVWKMLLGRLKRGEWCGKCFNIRRKVNRQKVLDLVQAKGYELRTDGEFGLKTKFVVYCPIHNLEWKSSYWNFKYSGNGGGTCKLCVSKAINYIDLKAFIESKNGTLIDKIRLVSGDRRNLIIKCNTHNTQFKTRWGDLKRGIWCRECSIEDRKITHKQIEELVESKNGTLLTQSCSTATMLFDVRCNADGCGRKWQTCYARIKQGCWCPKCIGFDRYTLDEVKQLVSDRGELLTTEISNAQQKVDIKCSCGCIFSIHIYNLARGGWCQACQIGYRVQKELYKIMVDLFSNIDVKYNQYPFDWLRDKGPLEIDIWVPSIKLAIEYDGEQHFRPVKFASTMTEEQMENAFKTTQAHDILKNQLISQHPDEIQHFIRFKYDEPITKEYVLDKLQKAGINI